MEGKPTVNHATIGRAYKLWSVIARDGDPHRGGPGAGVGCASSSLSSRGLAQLGFR